MNPTSTSSSPLLSKLKRHRARFLIPAICVAAAIWAGSWLLPTTFEATATFRRSTAAAMANPTLSPLRETIAQDVKSRAALEAIADDPALSFAETFERTDQGDLTAAGRREREAFIRHLELCIDVSAAVSSQAVDLVEVTVRDNDADTAATLANRLVESYIVNTRHDFIARQGEAENYFAEQIETQQSIIDELRQKKVQIEYEHPALGTDEAIASRDRLISTRAELRAVEQQLLPIEEEYASLSTWQAEQPEHLEQRTRGRNPKVAQLSAQKAELEQSLSEHRYKWGRTDEHPLVQKTLTKIATIDKALKATPKVIDVAAQRQANPAKLDAEARLKTLASLQTTLSARRDTLSEEVEKLEAQQQAAFAGRGPYEEINLALAEAHRELSFWKSKQRDAIYGQTAGGLELSVVERAATPTSPVFPANSTVHLSALIAGLCAGLLAVGAHRWADKSFDTVDSAHQELGLPVFGAITEFDETQEEPKQVTPLQQAA